MSKINKKEPSEIDTCDLFISPAIKDAGWEQITQVHLADVMVKQVVRQKAEQT